MWRRRYSRYISAAAAEWCALVFTFCSLLMGALAVPREFIMIALGLCALLSLAGIFYCCHVSEKNLSDRSRDLRRKRARVEISRHVLLGQKIRAQVHDGDVKALAVFAKEWQSEVEEYFRKHKDFDDSYVVRFRSNSGLPQKFNAMKPPERRALYMRLDGRLDQLHKFIEELSV